MVHDARDGNGQANPDLRQRHARGRLHGAGRARTEPEAAVSRPPPVARHVCPSVSRRREQGVLQEHLCEAAAGRCFRSSAGAGRRGPGLLGDPATSVKRLSAGRFPRPPQGRPDIGRGLGELQKNGRQLRDRPQLRPGVPNYRRRRNLQVPRSHEGPAGLPRHAGRRTRMGQSVLQTGDRPVRLRLHRRHDLHRRQGQTDSPLGQGRGPDRRQAGVHGDVRREDSLGPRQRTDRHLRQPHVPSRLHCRRVRRTVDGRADREGHRRGRREQRCHRDQCPPPPSQSRVHQAGEEGRCQVLLRNEQLDQEPWKARILP